MEISAERFVAGSGLLRSAWRAEGAWHLSRNGALVVSTAQEHGPGKRTELRIAYRSFRRLPGVWR